MNSLARQPQRSGQAARRAVAQAPGKAVETVRARVTELIPEYHLAHLETADGRGLALTRRTRGVEIATLKLGQMVECVVTLEQPRVVQAQAIA